MTAPKRCGHDTRRSVVGLLVIRVVVAASPADVGVLAHWHEDALVATLVLGPRAVASVVDHLAQAQTPLQHCSLEVVPASQVFEPNDRVLHTNKQTPTNYPTSSVTRKHSFF